MKRTIIGILGVTLLVVALSGSMLGAEEAKGESKPFGISAGVDYWTLYFWRGDLLYGENEDVFFPYVKWAVFDTGVTVGWTGEYARNSRSVPLKEKNAADFFVAYDGKFIGKEGEEKLLVGASLWYYYWYNSGYYTEEYPLPDVYPGRKEDGSINNRIDPNKDNQYEARYDASYWTGTVYVGLNVPLHPTVIYNHDYYSNNQEGTRRVASDWYLTLKVSEAFQLAKNVSLTLSCAASYYKNVYADDLRTWKNETREGWSDITSSAMLTVTLGNASLFGSGSWANRPNKGWYRVADGYPFAGTPGGHGDGRVFTITNVYWAAVGASYTL
ncbi:MAG TPA: hypothetical protein PKJ16_08665 [Spirochaetota bacterium]|nr:hypothetical protein [Spirochaetota bacterium]HPU87932.1 hypothetical protein [Spirochaetota bacterium]